MPSNLIATAAITVNAPSGKVWSALVTPDAIKRYLFGATVVSDWKEGSYFSPLAGLPDRPENYHTVTVELSADGAATRVSLAQDNNATVEAREHSANNWGLVLAGLKTYLEE